MFNLRKEEKGFTLIEIMVVLVILGILATISVPVYTGYVRKAKINEAVSNVGALANAIRIFKMEKDNWPTGGDATKITDNVKIDKHYFNINWTENTDGSLKMTISSTANFDAPGSFTYTIDENYQGTWADGTAKLLDKYASYLLR